MSLALIWKRLRLAWLALRYGARCVDLAEENFVGFELRVAGTRFYVNAFELHCDVMDGREIRLTANEVMTDLPDRFEMVLPLEEVR